MLLDNVVRVCPGCGKILTESAICPDCEAVKSRSYKKLFDDIAVLILEFQKIKKRAIRVKKKNTRMKKKR